MKNIAVLCLATLMAANVLCQKFTSNASVFSASSRTTHGIPDNAIFSETFENASGGMLPPEWNSFSSGTQGWYTGTSGPGPGQANENGFWPVPQHGKFVMTNDDVCNCDKSNDRLQLPFINLSTFPDLMIGFTAYQDGSGGQTAFVEVYTQDLGWHLLEQLPVSSGWKDYRIPVPGSKLTDHTRFRFRYGDNGNFASGLALDDVFLAPLPTHDLRMTEAFAINGNKANVDGFYTLLPRRQAQQAQLQFGAVAQNAGSSLETGLKLDVQINGPAMFSGERDGGDLYSLEEKTISFLSSDYAVPYKLGGYSVSVALSSDSTDEYPDDLSANMDFAVTQAQYARDNGIFDGSGIWLFSQGDKVASAFHFFVADTVHAVQLYIHPSTLAGSSVSFRLYGGNNLAVPIASSPSFTIGQEEIGSWMSFPLDSFLVPGDGEYFMAVQKQQGTVVIGTNRGAEAGAGDVKSYQSGSGAWTNYPYIPFLRLQVSPVSGQCPAFIAEEITYETCPDDGDASISVALVDGTASSYSWSSGQTTSIASGLVPGMYTVTIAGAGGCNYVDSFNIAGKDSLQVTFQVIADSCSRSVGQVEAIAVGGTAPYSYTWDGGSLSRIRKGLALGAYNITITDVNGCAFDTTVSVPGSMPFNLQPALEMPSCGLSNGSIEIQVSNGTGPFSFEWNNGVFSGDSIGAVPSGIYTLKAMDSVGCTQTISVSLADSNAPAITSATVQHVACYGSATGVVGITAAGNGPFDYAWSGNDMPNAAQATGLKAGIYTLTITDAGGCKNFFTDTIEHLFPELTATTSAVPVSCHGLDDGTAELQIFGGEMPYTIEWGTGETTPEVEGLTGGEVTFMVEGAAGCTDSGSIFIHEPLPLLVQVDSIVPESPDTGYSGAIWLSVYGGTAPYQYQWSDDAEGLDRFFLDSGNYEVVVTDANGCPSTLQVRVPLDSVQGIYDPNTGSVPLVVFPNPSNGILNILLGEGLEDPAIEIISMANQIVFYSSAWPSGNGVVDLAGMPPGVYIIIAKGSDGKVVRGKFSLVQ